MDNPSKKYGWQHDKYAATKAVPPEVVELNDHGEIHNKFHVDMLLPANENPVPLQILEDKDLGPIIGFDGDEEYFIDQIIRLRKWKGE